MHERRAKSRAEDLEGPYNEKAKKKVRNLRVPTHDVIQFDTILPTSPTTSPPDSPETRRPGIGDVREKALTARLQEFDETVRDLRDELSTSRHEGGQAKAKATEMETHCNDLEESLVDYQSELDRSRDILERTTKQLLQERKAASGLLHAQHRKEMEMQSQLHILANANAAFLEQSKKQSAVIDELQTKQSEETQKLLERYTHHAQTLQDTIRQQSEDRHTQGADEQARAIEGALRKLRAESNVQNEEDSKFREAIYAQLRALINAHIPKEEHKRILEAADARSRAEIAAVRMEQEGLTRKACRAKEDELHREFKQALRKVEEQMEALKESELRRRHECASLKEGLEARRSDISMLQREVQSEVVHKRALEARVEDMKRTVWLAQKEHKRETDDAKASLAEMSRKLAAREEQVELQKTQVLKGLARVEAANAERDDARTELQELAERAARDVKVLMDKEQIYKDDRDALLRAIDKTADRIEQMKEREATQREGASQRGRELQTALEKEKERCSDLQSRLLGTEGELDRERAKREQLQARAAAVAEQSEKENDLNRNLALSVTEMRKNHEAREKLYKQRLKDAQDKQAESESKAASAQSKAREMEQRLLQLKR